MTTWCENGTRLHQGKRETSIVASSSRTFARALLLFIYCMVTFVPRVLRSDELGISARRQRCRSRWSRGSGFPCNFFAFGLEILWKLPSDAMSAGASRPPRTSCALLIVSKLGESDKRVKYDATRVCQCAL